MLVSTPGILASGSKSEFDTTSFLYDGIDDFMETNANYTTLNNSVTFTISVWVKVNNLNTAQRILLISGGRRIFIYVSTTGKVDCSVRSSSNYIRSNAGAIVPGTWANIVWTCDTSQPLLDRYKLYINGQSNVSDNTGINTSLQTFTLLNVGLVSNRYLNGQINELAIWDTVLSSTQAMEIYNNGKADNLNNLATAVSPNNWWRSENATFNGTNWAVPDTNGLFPITTSNMGINSVVNDVP
jgi:hypothetical protein